MKYKLLPTPINSVLLLSGIIMLFYTAYRAYSLSFTHDESYSFNHYVNSSVIDIFTYNLNPIIANSHILNTLSMKWFSSMFGNSEFVLRFHSVLAHILYLIFTYLILKETQSKFILIFGFIILNCNPYLLDFFSFARGYAISISLMVISCYYLIMFIKHKKNSSLSTSLLISVLAVLGNFSLISFSASLIIVFELFFILSKENLKSIVKKNIPIILTAIALFLIYKGPIKVLINHNELNFGGNSGLWFDTVISSISCYLYFSPYFDTYIYFLRFLVVFVSIASIIILNTQFTTKSLNGFSYITIILFIILFASILQHLFLNTSYFKERFALFLVPLFFFALLNVITFLVNQTKWIKNTSYILAFLIISCSLSILYSSVNIKYSQAWRYDCNTKEMLEDLSKENTNIKLGITWLFEPAINFYRETNSLTWLQSVNRDGLPGDYDYYYVEANDLNSFDKSNKLLIKNYPESGATLYKKIK
jgi:uncharacterized membrane protein